MEAASEKVRELALEWVLAVLELAQELALELDPNSGTRKRCHRRTMGKRCYRDKTALATRWDCSMPR